MANDKYDDPVKDLGRKEMQKFSKTNLTGVLPRKKKVLYLPGAKNYESEVYTRQGIPAENCTGLENKRANFEELKRNANGINPVFCSFEDFIHQQAALENPERYDIISLDTETQMTPSFQKTLNTIFKAGLIKIPGVLMTNIYGQRENTGVKENYRSYESLRRTYQNIEEENVLGRPIIKGNRVVYDITSSEVKDNPLDFRSDGISGGILTSIVPPLTTFNREFNKAQIEFMRKYFGDSYDEALLGKAKDLKDIKECEEGEKRLLESYVDGKISLENLVCEERAINFYFNYQKMILDFLTNTTKGGMLLGAMNLALFDPAYIKSHKTFKYLSKNRGHMYLDFLSFDRPSNSYISGDLKKFKDSLVWKENSFMIGGYKIKNKEELKKVTLEVKNRLDRLDNFLRINSFTDNELNPAARIEFKLRETPKDRKEFSNKSKINLQNNHVVSQLDLIPGKYFSRLPPTYKERINMFIDQVNQEGLGKKLFSEVKESKWYKKQPLPEIDFFGFWDGLFLKAVYEGNLSRDDVNEIWYESTTKNYALIKRPVKTEETIKAEVEPQRDTIFIDRNHPDYERERTEIRGLLEGGKTIKEIIELKPHVNPRTISSISAWFNNADSWKKKVV